MRVTPKTSTLSFAGLKLIAGDLCLDFTNTVDWHASAQPLERLKTYQDLVAWSVQSALFDAEMAQRVQRAARRRRPAAATVLKRAVALREAMYRILVATLKKQAPPAADVGTFNRELRSALQHVHLVPGPAGFAWSWEADPAALDAMLWPLLRSAADLMTSELCARIGQCADDRGCGWLFLDATRNQSRRWCQMEDCGNRAKARRHYQRSRRKRTRTGNRNTRC